MKIFLFRITVLIPIALVFGGGYFLFFSTNFPKILYKHTRNLYFDCVEYSHDNTVYKLRKGKCPLSNIEYAIQLVSDDNGYRNALKLNNSKIVVTGDSHAMGYGVKAQKMFSSILSRKMGKEILNLGIPSYDTVRALEALKLYISNENIIVIQYCDNDYKGNLFFLKHGKEKYIEYVKNSLKKNTESYFRFKKRSLIGKLSFFLESAFHFTSNSNFYDMSKSTRNLKEEAKVFALVVSEFRKVLQNKRVIIFESSTWGKNHPLFQSLFSSALKQIRLDTEFVVLDSTNFLDKSHYYFFDDHLNAKGHKKIAEELYAKVSEFQL